MAWLYSYITEQLFLYDLIKRRSESYASYAVFEQRFATLRIDRLLRNVIRKYNAEKER